jgi:uncharacterized membrane protein YbaN (DUF454 family)
VKKINRIIIGKFIVALKAFFIKVYDSIKLITNTIFVLHFIGPYVQSSDMLRNYIGEHNLFFAIEHLEKLMPFDDKAKFMIILLANLSFVWSILKRVWGKIGRGK